MPPHCDSMDGPVVVAAREALDREDVDAIVPYVPLEAEEELRAAFDLAVKARTQGPEARTVADRFFFETAVRLHRAGEGAPFTGLKPAGLDVGPAIPAALRAIDTASPRPLESFLVEAIRREVAARLVALFSAKEQAAESPEAARRYVAEVLGLQVWSHRLYGAIRAHPHEQHA